MPDALCVGLIHRLLFVRRIPRVYLGSVAALLILELQAFSVPGTHSRRSKTLLLCLVARFETPEVGLSPPDLGHDWSSPESAGAASSRKPQGQTAQDSRQPAQRGSQPFRASASPCVHSARPWHWYSFRLSVALCRSKIVRARFWNAVRVRPGFASGVHCVVSIRSFKARQVRQGPAFHTTIGAVTPQAVQSHSPIFVS